jgi:hypothetical protein
LRSSDDWRQSPKDIIISGGENISSIEVEEALYKHPAVQAAAVVAPLGKYLRSGHVDCRGSLRPATAHTESLLGLWARRAGLFHEGARWCLAPNVTDHGKARKSATLAETCVPKPACSARFLREAASESGAPTRECH